MDAGTEMGTADGLGSDGAEPPLKAKHHRDDGSVEIVTVAHIYSGRHCARIYGDLGACRIVPTSSLSSFTRQSS